MRLTERNTAGLKLERRKSDWIWWDDDITGFGIRVRAGGSRKWIYRYRIGSKQRSLILGSAKSVPLSLARQNARKLEARVRLGEDPALDRQTAKLEVDKRSGASVP
jgi:Arm DNA-binding domain